MPLPYLFQAVTETIGDLRHRISLLRKQIVERWKGGEGHHDAAYCSVRPLNGKHSLCNSPMLSPVAGNTFFLNSLSWKQTKHHRSQPPLRQRRRLIW